MFIVYARYHFRGGGKYCNALFVFIVIESLTLCSFHYIIFVNSMLGDCLHFFPR